MEMNYDINDLLAIMKKLRDPETGCPWDVQQDFSSIAPYTIEEAYEVADAIQRGNLPDLQDELGDLLLQVVFHAQMASEQAVFNFDDVVGSICAKMIRRHPHVFAGKGAGYNFSSAANVDRESAAGEIVSGPFSSSTAQSQAWEDAKEQERQEQGALSLMDGIPRGMAELQRSVKLQKRAARAGFDWAAPGPVLDKLQEETEEIIEAMASGDPDRIEDELGDMLFVLTNLARQLKVNPAAALRRANAKFEQRFRALEQAAGSREQLDRMELDEMEALWQQLKAQARVAAANE